MRVFTEQILGGVQVGGHPLNISSVRHRIAFRPGDVAFNARKAKVGVLERVVIKKQQPATLVKTGVDQGVVYLDRHDKLWKAGDLTDEATARALVNKARP